MFYVLLALRALIALWSGLRLPETARQVIRHEKAPSLLASFKGAILNPQTFAYGLSGGLMFGALLAYVASAQQIFAGVYDAESLFPLLFGAVASVLAVASFVNARLVERLGMRKVSHTALAGHLAGSLALALASQMGWATLPVFAGLVAVMFFFFGLIAPNFNALAMEPQGDNAGMASSVIGSMGTGTAAVAGTVIGSAYDGTVLPLALGFAACSLITFAVVYAVEGRAGLFGRNR